MTIQLLLYGMLRMEANLQRAKSLIAQDEQNPQMAAVHDALADVFERWGDQLREAEGSL